MKFYDCKINLGGVVLHLVPKKRISAAEVTILFGLHGDDSIRDIVEVEAPDGKFSHRAEYDRLFANYAEDVIVKAFGLRTRTLRLPEEFILSAVSEDFDEDASEDEDGDNEDGRGDAGAEINRQNGVARARRTLSLPA